MNYPSTGLQTRVLRPNEVGFDYARTVLEINRAGWSYEQIALFCGYESKGTIAGIIQGAMPGHREGEALYILYVELFNRKPPLNVQGTEQLAST